MTSTALLVMDVQRGIVERFAGDDGYLQRLADAIGAARGADVAVIYVTVGFRPGYPEVSGRNKSFAAIAEAGRFTGTDPAAGIPAVIAPASGEVVVTKRRVSAFTGSDLDVVLRPWHRHSGPGGHCHQRRGAVNPPPGGGPGLPAQCAGRWLPRRRPRSAPGPAGEGVSPSG